MNNRIKELAEQSNITIRSYYDESGSTPLELEKFAELLIRECIDVVLMSSDRHRKEYFAGLIKQHFGVQP